MRGAGTVGEGRRSFGREPGEIAFGVFWLSASGSNVYFVRSGLSWVLIDISWPDRVRVIKQAAERLFGAGTCPAAILLTHTHGDHAGSALELARSWDLPGTCAPASCRWPRGSTCQSTGTRLAGGWPSR